MMHCNIVGINYLSRAPSCALLMLLAIALAGLVPRGWMPTHAQGQILLTLCSGEGVETVSIPVDQQLPDEHDTPDRSCRYATMAAAGPLPQAPLFVERVSRSFPAWEGAAWHEAPKNRPVGIRPPLRGPPLVI